MQSVKSISYCALGYFALAELGLNFSYKDTNACPIWPAAGLGMYVAVFYGRVAATGIIIGSLLANYVFFLAGREEFLQDDFLLSLTIGICSYLQAVLGAWLLYGKPDRDLFFGRGTVRFIMSMSITCLVAATGGVLGLVFVKGLPLTNFYETWIFWYVGDLSGIILFLPLFSVMKIRGLICIERCFIAFAVLISSGFIFTRLRGDVYRSNILFGIVSDQLLSIMVAVIFYSIVAVSIADRRKRVGQ